MDGNNRWSKIKKIDFDQAYIKGAENLFKTTKFIFSNYDIPNISAFALSKHNLKRSKPIVKTLKKILYKYLLDISDRNFEFDIKFIGDFSVFDNNTISLIQSFNKKNHFRKKLFVFLNYSGREDINNILNKSNYKNEKNIEKFLLTKDIPDPDILVRTGGFSRISDFMLYQISFTELFFLKKLWPDFNNTDIKAIIKKFKNIERKFGR